MAEILIMEPDANIRDLLRFLLEGIDHRVLTIEDWERTPLRLEDKGPDLILLGIHVEGDLGDFRIWRRGLPEAPVLVLYSGDPNLKEAFLDAWEGTPAIKCLHLPLEPYPFLAMVKAMLAAPAVWRQGGQHAL